MSQLAVMGKDFNWSMAPCHIVSRINQPAFERVSVGQMPPKLRTEFRRASCKHGARALAP